ncbi:hypothetical protein BGZ83_006816 [Gryganskiella cystojenkinii]|nr:hypothetical protein BGZ83_006816 [Gryganskiella cystojenkinii]
MVVFGDSFSDTGNVFNLSDGSWPEPLFFPDGRFSNGKVWTDYVTQEKQLKTTNFAFGGATTDSRIVQGYSGREADLPVPGFHQQLDAYRDTFNDSRFGSHSEDQDSTLFVISFQGNDFVFDPTVGTEQVLSNLESGIRRLIEDLGARHLIVVENFDFGKVPFFLANETLSRENTALAQKQHREYQDLTERMRRDYGKKIVGLERLLDCQSGNEEEEGEDNESSLRSGVGIAFFDLFALFDRLHSPKELKRLGLWDVRHGCVDDRATRRCDDPSGHFFYDSYHPSTKVHREVANGILGLI